MEFKWDKNTDQFKPVTGDTHKSSLTAYLQIPRYTGSTDPYKEDDWTTKLVVIDENTKAARPIYIGEPIA